MSAGKPPRFIGCSNCNGRTNRSRHDECVWCGSELGSNSSTSHTHNATQRKDPTRTTTVKKRFAGHLRQRFNAIKFHINKGIIENDAFNLTGGPGHVDIGRLTGNVPTDDDVTPGVGAFDFAQDADAIEAFDQWLDEALDREILQEYSGDQYVRQGYGRGVKHAGQQIKRHTEATPPDEPLTVTLERPVHSETLQVMYGRAFNELRGVNDATAQEMRRVLTEGLSQGEGPRKIARDLNDRVEKVGKTRARTLARTEVANAHVEGTRRRYKEYGVENVKILLAPDACPLCTDMKSREPFTPDEAASLLPRHPNCRCATTLADS